MKHVKSLNRQNNKISLKEIKADEFEKKLEKEIEELEEEPVEVELDFLKEELANSAVEAEKQKPAPRIIPSYVNSELEACQLTGGFSWFRLR